MNNIDTQHAERRWPTPLLLALGTGALALVARLLYVQFFSTPMPFWDQWDGEWVTALKPWLDGTLHWSTLLTAHNEHRILPTRLVTLASYLATGEWNNVYEARISAVVFCFIPALLVWHAVRDEAAAGWRWLMVLLVVLLSVLPFARENFLVGFQSQFYFLILSSVIAIALVARHHQNPIALLGAMALSVLAIVTMASGLLTAVAVGAVCVLACWCLPGRRAPALCAMAALAVIAVVAYTQVPVLAAHSALRAQSVGELLQAATYVLAWPGRSNGVFIIAWLPAVVMIGRMLVRRQVTPTGLVMAGLCVWSALQGLAIGYGRGHDALHPPASRYTELLVPGLVGNAWFALQLWGLLPSPSPRRIAARSVAVLFALLLVGGTLSQVSKDFRRMKEFNAACRLQQENVVRYLTSGDPKALEVGYFELPYPDATHLKRHLDDPALRRILPATIHASAPSP
jgi:hypothetical protein